MIIRNSTGLSSVPTIRYLNECTVHGKFIGKLKKILTDTDSSPNWFCRESIFKNLRRHWSSYTPLVNLSLKYFDVEESITKT